MPLTCTLTVPALRPPSDTMYERVLAESVLMVLPLTTIVKPLTLAPLGSAQCTLTDRRETQGCGAIVATGVAWLGVGAAGVAGAAGVGALTSQVTVRGVPTVPR